METNPIRILRTLNHKSLQEWADLCGVHLQTVYLNECGVFPTILPKIKTVCLRKGGQTESELTEAYKKFVLDKRRLFSIEYADKVNILPDPDLTKPPFQHYRQTIGPEFTRMGFAKTICVEPAGLYRLETKPLAQIPGRISEALLQVGMSSDNLEELEERTNEFYSRCR